MSRMAVAREEPLALSGALRLVVFLGVGLRLLAWAANRSVWLDEAALIHEIQTRNFAKLAQKLDLAQAAP